MYTKNKITAAQIVLNSIRAEALVNQTPQTIVKLIFANILKMEINHLITQPYYFISFKRQYTCYKELNITQMKLYDITDALLDNDLLCTRSPNRCSTSA